MGEDLSKVTLERCRETLRALTQNASSEEYFGVPKIGEVLHRNFPDTPRLGVYMSAPQLRVLRRVLDSLVDSDEASRIRIIHTESHRVLYTLGYRYNAERAEGERS